jgi:hypothetical protein
VTNILRIVVLDLFWLFCELYPLWFYRLISYFDVRFLFSRFQWHCFYTFLFQQNFILFFRGWFWCAESWLSFHNDANQANPSLFNVRLWSIVFVSLSHRYRIPNFPLFFFWFTIIFVYVFRSFVPVSFWRSDRWLLIDSPWSCFPFCV